jgi:thiol-disulfide isomerase/thioredoxin
VIESVDDGIVLITVVGSTPERSGLGSGVVISQEGLIATNYHVVEDALQAVVQFRDGSEYEVAGYRLADRQRDLAILELRDTITASEFFEVDPSVTIRQGENVIALGHPSGFKYSVSTGIVSAIRSTHELPREVQSILDTSVNQTWIQTTAAISGGNSGGPLMNSSGKLLGINTWVAGGENLGFALHVQHLSEIMDDLPPEVRALPIEREMGDAAEPTHPDVVDLATKMRFEFEDFALRLQRADSAEQVARILQANNPAGHYIRQFLQLAKRYSGEPAALESLVMVCRLSQWSGDSHRPLISQAFDQLLDDHLKQASMKDVVLALIGSRQDDVPDFLKRVIEDSEDSKVEGLARFALATVLLEQAHPSATGEAQAEPLLEQVIAKHASTSVAGRSLGELAELLLFEAQHLRIGKPAVEIEGPDHLGNSLALSDLRGKVVVLDFWADWCPHCRAMYPEERLLVRDFADRPLALVGVNCDSPARFRDVMASGAITWQSWSDGQRGPIAQQWQVNTFPTVYVLDHHGKIRFQGLRGDDLHHVVELLVELAEYESREEKRPELATAKNHLTELTRIRSDLSKVYIQQREWLAAIEQLRELHEPLARRVQSDPTDLSLQRRLLDVQVALGEVNLWMGNHVGAAAAFEEALEVLATVAEKEADGEMLSKAAGLYLKLGAAGARQGDHQRALVAYQSATELDPDAADAKNSLAWFLATCPLDNWRNGTLAVKLAQSACEATDWKNFQVIDTLAAALAEAGDFEAAVERQKEALKLAPTEWRSSLQTRLDRYESGEPYRDKS